MATDVRKAQRERERGRRFFRDLDRDAKNTIGDELVLGSFDWREWMDKKPSAAFMGGLDEERIHWEIMTTNPESRAKNLIDPDEAEREYKDAIKKAAKYLDDAEKALNARDSSLAFGYLIAGAESLGLALGHLHYIANVDPAKLGRYRGQRDRLEAMQRAFRARLFDPSAELIFNPGKLKRRLT